MTARTRARLVVVALAVSACGRPPSLVPPASERDHLVQWRTLLRAALAGPWSDRIPNRRQRSDQSVDVESPHAESRARAEHCRLARCRAASSGVECTLVPP